jgi:hypothetical protein
MEEERICVGEPPYSLIALLILAFSFSSQFTKNVRTAHQTLELALVWGGVWYNASCSTSLQQRTMDGRNTLIGTKSLW